ncbi:MAG TPA: dissimilatory sulfite reductase D family protein [Smithellaceae bacterium]|nr:dissimilatory sulfite reductase D family protein [Smithellaceae bacterium]HOG80772.1 dissimilatory sulfite reductase D family protein [Smithellaceae bacterium]HOQ42058.1 dissimilatory sulfite reductase D family protein [Smithellaceae bacterium]HPL66144.1 dissimilatory sulfite reductase D family protein [Smithellaceae bacterium]
MSEDLKVRVTNLFREKSRGDKKMFYIRDVTKWLPDEDRHAVQNVVKELLDEEVLKYWSSGSSTYIMLAEFFPKE